MSQPASKKTKRELELEAVPKPVIGFGDMDSKLTDIVLNSARVAYLAKQKGEVESWKDVAESIVKDVSIERPGSWHCVVGSTFGSFVSHEKAFCLYFSIGPMTALLYKHG